jgi:hypothetical protein
LPLAIVAQNRCPSALMISQKVTKKGHSNHGMAKQKMRYDAGERSFCDAISFASVVKLS